jgi:inward rectifier potassium channel
MKINDPGSRPFRASAKQLVRETGRVAIIRGRGVARYTDIYHQTLTASWPVFLIGLMAVFLVLNLIFAGFYMLDTHGFTNAHDGDFWERFVFSVQTMGSVPYTEATPRSRYVDIVVIVEAFVGILYIGTLTAVLFARLSRPSARVVFSQVATITPYDGVPTLMFRAANARGNQVLDANVNVTLARQATSKEGMTMRRFDELQLMRARTSLFALSWTIMHRIDESSPLHGLTSDDWDASELELIILLSGRDEVLADTIYARHAYEPSEITWNHRFVDVLSMTNDGRRVVDLTKFHDTEPHPVELRDMGG